MNTLEKLAKKIGEIGDDISILKSLREANLDKCNGSIDDDFNAYWQEQIEEGNHELTNCLMATYEYVKEGRSHGEPDDYEEKLYMYGCVYCIEAHKLKRKIGLLKMERGRIVGNISKIGKSL